MIKLDRMKFTGKKSFRFKMKLIYMLHLRLEAVQKYLTGEEKVISCMANPQYGTLESMTEDECFSACLAAVRPGCVGDTLVDFNHFNQAMCSCSDQLMKRFREFVVTGMCHLCQVLYYWLMHKFICYFFRYITWREQMMKLNLPWVEFLYNAQE